MNHLVVCRRHNNAGGVIMEWEDEQPIPPTINFEGRRYAFAGDYDIGRPLYMEIIHL